MLIWGLLAGIFFGYILQRVGALEYDNILKMLRLLDLRIMQFMFFAVAVSLTGIFTLHAFGVGTITNLPFHPGVVTGGLVFGVGFALAGYCPGTVIGALAEGKKDARFVFLGALCGTFAYAFLHKLLKPALIDRGNLGNLTFDTLLGMSPLLTALLFAVAITVGMFLTDRIVPVRHDKKMSPPV
ncbi:MAG: YeeE/YedE thiosulfate transporter family protein [Bacillota bacterium]|nr:YeeE/YedE thiosulfate transporter family protein [Bacillota bacterium]MDW7682844.1 YeeE/YedE thiosulfate transporter family protein [Bacillota bacterium]